MKKYFIMIVSLTLGASVACAQESGGSFILSLAGVVNTLQGSDSGGSPQLGGGVLIEAGINDNFGLETGALLVNRHYTASSGPFQIEQEVNRLHVPITARFWASDYFSLALGPFVAFKTGETKTNLRVGDFDLGTVKTSADDSVEYGMDAAATFNFAINDKTGIFVEGRYSSVFEKEDDEKADEISGLAGVKIDM